MRIIKTPVSTDLQDVHHADIYEQLAVESPELMVHSKDNNFIIIKQEVVEYLPEEEYQHGSKMDSPENILMDDDIEKAFHDLLVEESGHAPLNDPQETSFADDNNGVGAAHHGKNTKKHVKTLYFLAMAPNNSHSLHLQDLSLTLHGLMDYIGSVVRDAPEPPNPKQDYLLSQDCMKPNLLAVTSNLEDMMIIHQLFDRLLGMINRGCSFAVLSYLYRHLSQWDYYHSQSGRLYRQFKAPVLIASFYMVEEVIKQVRVAVLATDICTYEEAVDQIYDHLDDVCVGVFEPLRVIIEMVLEQVDKRGLYLSATRLRADTKPDFSVYGRAVGGINPAGVEASELEPTFDNIGYEFDFLEPN